jgi:hypothetical protein
MIGAPGGRPRYSLPTERHTSAQLRIARTRRPVRDGGFGPGGRSHAGLSSGGQPREARYLSRIVRLRDPGVRSKWPLKPIPCSAHQASPPAAQPPQVVLEGHDDFPAPAAVAVSDPAENLQQILGDGDAYRDAGDCDDTRAMPRQPSGGASLPSMPRSPSITTER